MKDSGDLLALPAGHSVPPEGLSKDSMEVVFPVVIHSVVSRPAIHSVVSPEASMAAAVDNYVIQSLLKNRGQLIKGEDYMILAFLSLIHRHLTHTRISFLHPILSEGKGCGASYREA
jgi:hypothetical protein